MAENLTDFMKELEATKPGSFTPGAYYYGREEDSLTLYLRNEESYAHRLNNLVTIFLSTNKDELVGCQVKGLRRKLLSDGSFGIAIHREGRLHLGLFFHLLAFEVQEDEPRDRLIELGQKTKGIEVDTRELALSC
jgi:hypothetical protein